MEHKAKNEIEYKFRVRGEEDLRKFAVAYGVTMSVENATFHLTRVFDTEDRVLLREGLSLRWRTESRFDADSNLVHREHVVLLKGPDLLQRGKAMLARHVEGTVHGELENLDGQAALHDLAPSALVELATKLVADKPVLYLGAYTNIRWCVPIFEEPGYKFPGGAIRYELDRTRFSDDVTHCEIEVEMPKPRHGFEESMRAWFEHLGLHLLDDQPSSKVERFFKTVDGR